MLNQVKDAVRRQSLLSPGEGVVVAVSGGVDSVTLLDLLLELKDEYALKLSVAHVNHGLRGEEATADAQFVERLAQAARLPYYLKEIKLKSWARREGLNVQAAGRQVRRDFFQEIQAKVGAQKIALGHNADDQVETVLWRIFRGAGLEGLAGMTPAGDQGIIRPLLYCRRAEILAYARSRGLTWREDSSNRDAKYLRNRLRLEIIPLLEEKVNPRAAEAVLRLSYLAKSAMEYMEVSAAPGVERLLTSARSGQRLLRSEFLSLHPYPRLELMRRLWWEAAGATLEEPPLRLWETAVEWLALPGTGGRMSLPGRVEAVKEYEYFYLERVDRPVAQPEGGSLAVPGRLALGTRGELTAEWVTASPAPEELAAAGNEVYLDGGAIRLPLQVRVFRAGDRFYPLGAPGAKKLKDFFIDHKIPPSRRRILPLVINQDEIIWVAGLRPAEPYRLRPETQTILHLSWKDFAA